MGVGGAGDAFVVADGGGCGQGDCNVTLTFGGSPCAPNSFSTAALMFWYICRTISKNASTNASACSCYELDMYIDLPCDSGMRQS